MYLVLLLKTLLRAYEKRNEENEIKKCEKVISKTAGKIHNKKSTEETTSLSYV